MNVDLRYLAHTALLVCLAGCQSGQVVERLDTPSGLTIVSGADVAAFARTDGRFSRSARDYVYLGPVEINERGTREYFLWVGIASTIDRRYLAAERAKPVMLVLELAGAPTEFELEAWDERMPRLSGRAIYDPTVQLSDAMAARVTLDQLAMISAESPDSIRLGSTDEPMIEYFSWNSSPEWTAFLDHAGYARSR